jgi:hypothetical protein
MVDVADYPPMLMLMRLPEAAILSGADPDEATMDLWIKVFRSDAGLLRRKYGLGRFGLPTVRVDVSRLVYAKIAHSFAVAELGLGNFTPMLNPVILGEPADARLFVGGFRNILPASDTCLHWIRYEFVERNGERFIAVRFRLFSYIDESPEYLVLAGRPREGVVYPQPVTKKVFHAKDVKTLPPYVETEPLEFALYGGSDREVAEGRLRQLT